MGRLLFNILLKPLLYLISWLPFWMLYRLSDLLFVLAYYIIGYRKKVVTENLQRSFPEKSAGEIAIIRKQFYGQFCDVIVETIKLLTIREKEFRRRCFMPEAEQQKFNQFLQHGRSIVGIAGHAGNWEWSGVAIQVYFSGKTTSTYHPLSNQSMDRFMLTLRSGFGGRLYPMNQLFKQLVALRQKGITTLIGLVADQTPPPESAYWTTFLNQDTPVFNGPEKLARKFDYPVIYMPMRRLKRGYYELEALVVTDTPHQLPEGEISERHVRILENEIKRLPYSWLWSHRRWKHKKPA